MTLPNPDQSADLARMLQRQLLLLAHQGPDQETELYTWPTMSGLSVRQSIRSFEILERQGWIAGFPAGIGVLVARLPTPANKSCHRSEMDNR